MILGYVLNYKGSTLNLVILLQLLTSWHILYFTKAPKENVKDKFTQK